MELLASAETGPLDKLQRARVDLLRARIAFAVNRDIEALPLLLRAAKELEPLDAGLARETYLDAFWAALCAGRPASRDAMREVAGAALAAPPAQTARATDLLLDGLALRYTEGYPAAAPVLRQALSAFRSEDIAPDEGTRWLGLASTIAVDLWDDETWDVLSARHLQLARDAGAVTMLPMAVGQRIGVHLHAGELGAAASLIQELVTALDATGAHRMPYGPVWLAAWRGREPAASEQIEASTKDMVDHDDALGLTIVQWATALLYNGLGRYEGAVVAAEEASTPSDHLVTPTWGLMELIEAATRSGMPDRAADALKHLSHHTRASATDWALGIEARSRALLSDGKQAEDLYREALDRLGRTRVRAELARAHLLYGEWLRRGRRRIDAREQLRTAHEMFSEMGLEAFAQRAARELRATGETARKRSIETSSELTAQEAQISRLARDGLSNPEIGSQLFISPRTVEYHLRKVFGKLNINSRNQLGHVLAPVAPSVPNAGSSVAEYAG
jgi:DNA-binding CsgD family transcriptional regulator